MAGRRDRAGGNRKKVELACVPCRERKARCDGERPICSTCQRRSLPARCCVYAVENERTKIQDAYIKGLHDRIDRLERICDAHGIPTPPLAPDDGTAAPTSGQIALRPAAGPSSSASTPPISLSVSGVLREREGRTLSPSIDHKQELAALTHASPIPDSERIDNASSSAMGLMGTVSEEHDSSQAFDETNNEFYGSSSAASFMKEAYVSVKKPNPNSPTDTPGASSEPERIKAVVPAFSVAALRPPEVSLHRYFSQVGHFALPPRSLADSLLGLFFDRVYWLYPFFHKPTFLHAYRNLWKSRAAQARSPPPPSGLGLGSAPGGDAGSIVFHCALNVIFAIGCQFSDLSPKDKIGAIETFFSRAKVFIGLDFLDMHNVGVVQALLLMTLILQSTPFPSRCWNSIGVACRVAQGLGLHSEGGGSGKSELETEIRRRTWHACVILDVLVSMTYGRPTMTTQLHELPLPRILEYDAYNAEDESAGIWQGNDIEVPSSKLCFYVDYIRQCRIMGEILTTIYNSSHKYSQHSTPSVDVYSGLEEIFELDGKLAHHEATLSPLMSWTNLADTNHLPEKRKNIILTQRTMLHGSFLFFRLTLHRPILTKTAKEAGSTLGPSPQAVDCVKVCLNTAVELIELVHATYLTETTGGWWWDGLYAFTGGLAIIVAYLCPTVLASVDRQRMEKAWNLCQEIVTHFASFSISSNRSLKLLQKVHGDVIAQVSDPPSDMMRPVPVPMAMPIPMPGMGGAMPAMSMAAMPTQHATANGAGHSSVWDGMAQVMQAQQQQQYGQSYPQHASFAVDPSLHEWQFAGEGGGVDFDVNMMGGAGGGVPYNWDQTLDLTLDMIAGGIPRFS
ncbi:fungal-specific transcription factor domain-containing protein [Podospora australis]|uniref:Fungal-specific transcription factor domain-containing protein n=1 Tax=Podospora australis TaxID=1536484 RepID=A0AAN7AF09_9PEZI|nr:fungal-specific transcription factor domain-containing protein [Podospora australis]